MWHVLPKIHFGCNSLSCVLMHKIKYFIRRQHFMAFISLDVILSNEMWCFKISVTFFIGDSPCDGSCSHLCLLYPGSFRCACPFGMSLEDGSNTTCIGKLMLSISFFFNEFVQQYFRVSGTQASFSQINHNSSSFCA